MAVPAYPGDSEAEAPGFERCTISRWRGYVSSTFVAVLEDGTPIAESSAFRARGQQIPPDSEAARAAFAEIRAELERQEWDAAAGEFDPWYEAVFTRPVEAPEPAVQTVAAPQLAPQLAPPPPAPAADPRRHGPLRPGKTHRATSRRASSRRRSSPSHARSPSFRPQRRRQAGPHGRAARSWS